MWALWDGRATSIGFQVEIIDDPLGVAEAAVDRLDGTRRPTSWVKRLTGARQITTSVDLVQRYAGRECCYHHLVALEPRLSTELRVPFETECSECRRRFRVTIGFGQPGEGRWRTTTTR